MSVKYQSQRSQYLRIVLDAEREIARLEGLYEASDGDTAGAVVFTIRRDTDAVTGSVGILGLKMSRTVVTEVAGDEVTDGSDASGSGS